MGFSSDPSFTQILKNITEGTTITKIINFIITFLVLRIHYFLILIQFYPKTPQGIKTALEN